MLSKELEQQDEVEARRRIAEAVSQVRRKLHGNDFLLQHNIEYGTIRNLIGGSIVGFILCLVNAAFFYFIFRNNLAITITLFLGFIFLIIILFGKPIINGLGNAYAKILFREYLS